MDIKIGFIIEVPTRFESRFAFLPFQYAPCRPPSVPAAMAYGEGAATTPPAERELPSATTSWKRPTRSAADRRAQARRAEGRIVQHLLRCVGELGSHRGCQPTQLGAALATLLKSSTALATSTRAKTSVQTDYLEEHFAQATVAEEKGHTAALKETSTQTEAYREKPAQRTLEEADVYIENVPRKEVAAQTARDLNDVLDSAGFNHAQTHLLGEGLGEVQTASGLEDTAVLTDSGRSDVPEDQNVLYELTGEPSAAPLAPASLCRTCTALADRR